jgi:hypothetical protein
MGLQTFSEIVGEARVMPFRIVFAYNDVDVMEILHRKVQSSGFAFGFAVTGFVPGFVFWLARA